MSYLLRPSSSLARWLRQAALCVLAIAPFASSAAEQQRFPTPEAAIVALRSALKSDKDEAIVALFGEKYRHLVVAANRGESSASRSRILAALEAFQTLEAPAPDRRTVVIGPDAWPMPIPLVLEGGQWRFGSELGEDEILNRRVGANERYAIGVLRSALEAQKRYAARDRNGDQVLEYAQRHISTQGKHDGLYWPADPAKGEEESPFGPLLAASRESLAGIAAGDPLRGYRYRILKRQGKNAAGGAYSYVINGRMLAGHAMLSFPAHYGLSGVMTLMVNQNGTIYEKDLGPDTARKAAAIAEFNPDASWKKLNDPR